LLSLMLATNTCARCVMSW